MSGSNNETGLKSQVLDYSSKVYPASLFSTARCLCGHGEFLVYFDETAGCAVRVCASCQEDHFVGDSEDYLEEAELSQAECTCGGQSFELCVGLALYGDSSDVRWFYLGLQCAKCGLGGVYADWKNEYVGASELLSRI